MFWALIIKGKEGVIQRIYDGWQEFDFWRWGGGWIIPEYFSTFTAAWNWRCCAGGLLPLRLACMPTACLTSALVEMVKQTTFISQRPVLLRACRSEMTESYDEGTAALQWLCHHPSSCWLRQRSRRPKRMTTYHQCLFPQQYMEVAYQHLVLVKIAVGRAWLRLLPTPIPKLLNYPHEEFQSGAQLGPYLTFWLCVWLSVWLYLVCACGLYQKHTRSVISAELSKESLQAP